MQVFKHVGNLPKKVLRAFLVAVAKCYSQETVKEFEEQAHPE